MNLSKLILVILSLFCITTGCAKVEERNPIRLSISLWPGYAHAFIAREKGFFKKNYVDVELVLVKTATEAVELFKANGVDGVFDVFTDVIVFNADKIPSKVVYISDYSEQGDVIIGRPAFSSLSDLKGRKIGFEGVNSFSHIFVLKALEKSGINEIDVRFKDIPAMDVLDALEKGVIDAGHTWDPVKTQALKKGYRILITAKDIPGIIVDVLAFHTHAIEKRPKDVQNIVKSLLEARDFIFSHRDEALEIMSRAEGMARDEMENGINAVHMLNLEENITAMTHRNDAQSLYPAFDMITDFYMTRGQVSEKQDIGDVVESRFAENLRLLQKSE